MLFLLWTYLCFHWAQPTFAAPFYNATASNTEIAPAWVAGPSGRGTWSLLYSCIFTIGLCVWTSIHLNVPPPGQSAWLAYRRKVKWVLIALFAPEAVVYTAFSQWLTAKTFLRELKRIADVIPSKNPKCANAMQPKHAFDTTYAYYATMGGFAVDIGHLHNNVAQGTITTSGLLLLAQQGHYFNVSRESIADKSKANLLAKSLVCLQVIWVAGQAIERKIAGFPISLLEFHAIVHVVCALIMYTLWFRKPYDINEPTVIPAEDFPDALAFIVSSSSWAGNSGFRVNEPYTNRTEYWFWLLNGGHKDPVFYYYGHLEKTGQAELEPIGEGERPVDVADSRLINYLLRKRKLKRDLRGNQSIESPSTGPELSTEFQYFAANRISPGTTFNPTDGADTILTLESGQALHSGLGPRVHWNSRRYSTGDRIGLSQKDLNRLNMAGNFVRELLAHRNSEFRASFNHPVFQNSDLKDHPFSPFKQGVLRPYGERLICWKQSNWTDQGELFDIFYTFGEIGRIYGIILIAFAMILIPAAYGGIHLAASHTVFPSAVELTLWNASCFTLLGFAALLVLGILGVYVFAVLLNFWDKLHILWVPRWMKDLAMWATFGAGAIVASVAALLYIAARVFIVVESFISLRHVPIGVYQTPDANILSYIPHL